MGKTRVVHEAAATIGARYDARVIEGRAVPYGEANAWWPIADVLRQVFGLEVDASAEQARFVIDGGLVGHLDELDSDVHARYSVALRHALGYPTPLRNGDRDTNRAEVMLAFTALLEAELERRPVVLIITDVHLAAEGVQLLLEHVLQELSRARLLVLLTAKTSAPLALPVGRYGSMVLPLNPLDAAAGLAMLDEFDIDITHEAKQRIVERSGGNPLFLEELAGLVKSKSRADLGATASSGELSALPDSLRGIIAARLDSLDPTLRSLIEAAAVFGPNGPLSGLRRMAELELGFDDIDPLLAQLVEADLLVLDAMGHDMPVPLLPQINSAIEAIARRPTLEY